MADSTDLILLADSENTSDRFKMLAAKSLSLITKSTQNGISPSQPNIGHAKSFDGLGKKKKKNLKQSCMRYIRSRTSAMKSNYFGDFAIVNCLP